MKQLQSVGRPVSSSALMSLLEVYDSSEWHEIAGQDLPALPSKAKSAGTVDNAKLLRSGKELMAVLARAYSRHVCDTDTEKAWMRAVAKDPFIPPDKKNTATLCDSLDAMAVLASESCALNYKFITLLLGMCQNTATRVMLCSMERMHALFMEVLPGRKLRYIDQLDASRQRYLQHHLLTWEKGGAATWDSLEPLARVVLHVVCFEDFLKGAYAAFIQLVTDQLDGGPPFVQRKMLHYVLEMLAKKPEQEGLLLDILVGRLFSNDLKLSAMASAKLTSLLECHGGMKDIVVRRVGSMLLGSIGKVHTTFASHNDAAATKKKKKRRSKALPSELIPILRSIHRGVLFLTEIHFTRKDTKATSEALKCYMCVLSFIFKPSTGDKRSRLLPTYEYEEFSRIIRCISSGLERCISLVRHREGSFDIFDYGSGEGDASRESMEKSIASLFRAARKPISCSTNIGLLSLIAQIQRSEDRFYNLLYERILDIRMYAAVNRRALLTLAANCMSNDKDTCRVAAFVKRLLQVASCIVGAGVCTVISRICRGAIYANTPLHAMIKAAGDDSYNPKNPDPSASEADKSHLWERHLNSLSYHPTVAAECRNMLKGLPDGVVNFEAPSLFEELGAVSGQLSTGDFAYTQRSYWTSNRKALPHQEVFKQFFLHCASCDVSKVKRKDRRSDEVDDIDASDEEEELRDVDGMSDESGFGDERMSDDVSDSEEFDEVSDSDGEFDDASDPEEFDEISESEDEFGKVSGSDEEMDEVSGSDEEMDEVSGSDEEMDEVSGSDEEMDEVSGSDEEIDEVSGSDEEMDEVSGSHEEMDEVAGSDEDLGEAYDIDEEMDELSDFDDMDDSSDSDEEMDEMSDSEGGNVGSASSDESEVDETPVSKLKTPKAKVQPPTSQPSKAVSATKRDAKAATKKPSKSKTKEKKVRKKPAEKSEAHKSLKPKAPEVKGAAAKPVKADAAKSKEPKAAESVAKKQKKKQAKVRFADDVVDKTSKQSVGKRPTVAAATPSSKKQGKHVAESVPKDKPRPKKLKEKGKQVAESAPKDTPHPKKLKEKGKKKGTASTVPSKAKSPRGSDASTEPMPIVVESKRQKRKREAREREEAHPDYERRKKVSLLLQKATKGSFADISDIPGMDEFL